MKMMPDTDTAGASRDRALPIEEKKILCCIGIVNDLVAALATGRSPETIRLSSLCTRWSKRLTMPFQPRLVDIIAAVPQEHRHALLPLLLAKPVRTASGVAVIAVMCKPHRCPHIAMTGNVCVYCPGGPDSDFEYSTQSYTGYEPTSMRAIRARYDPYEQARSRLDQLRGLGHPCDKVEYVLMGGTFMSLPESYRNWFIARLHDALSGQPPAAAPPAGGNQGASVAELDASVRLSEQSAQCKCVGLTIETRPDYCLRPHLAQLLRYGCTRLEIGVQSVYEDVARDTNRGHTVRAVCESFEMAKDAGFKVVAHMMPDLPNVGIERDIAQFREYFENPRFRSDGLKIYPTLVIRGTGLYELWRSGRYRSYAPSELVDLVARILALVPPWTRVYRVQRDIPMPLVSAGVEHGNLRELADARLRDLGSRCRDVRSREIGISAIAESICNAQQQKQQQQQQFPNVDEDHGGESVNGEGATKKRENRKQRQRQPDTSCTPQTKVAYARALERLELVRRDYAANGGWETFLAYEDPEADVLVGMLRLRQCSPQTFRSELRVNNIPQSIVRELHVYGSVVPLHSRDPIKFQHQGLGKLLMEEAERIARCEHGSVKLAVISGVGTRNYYRKLGYESDGPYMSRSLCPLML